MGRAGGVGEGVALDCPLARRDADVEQADVARARAGEYHGRMLSEEVEGEDRGLPGQRGVFGQEMLAFVVVSWGELQALLLIEGYGWCEPGQLAFELELDHAAFGACYADKGRAGGRCLEAVDIAGARAGELGFVD